MTTSDDDLVKQLREMAADAEHAADDNDGDIDERIALYGNQAADTITRLTRELASARAEGWREGREACAAWHDLKAADARSAAKLGSFSVEMVVNVMAEDHEQSAKAIRSLPAPSAQEAGAEPWVEKVRDAIGYSIEPLHELAAVLKGVSLGGHAHSLSNIRKALREVLSLLPSSVEKQKDTDHG